MVALHQLVAGAIEAFALTSLFRRRKDKRRTPQAAFQTLLGLGTSRGPTTYKQIVRVWVGHTEPPTTHNLLGDLLGAAETTG